MPPKKIEQVLCLLKMNQIWEISMNELAALPHSTGNQMFLE